MKRFDPEHACFKVIIDMAVQASATGSLPDGALDSGAIGVYAGAMEFLAKARLREIEADFGHWVFGRLTAEGKALSEEDP